MENKLCPFFCYYGGKWRAAPWYPKPKYKTIIEPFAGAAGYSTRYANYKVILLDRDPLIVNLWRYLIKVSKEEILGIPSAIPNTIKELAICEEAKWLVGFWCNKGTSRPCKQPSTWMKSNTRPNSYWGEAIRGRIASQLEAIRHWQIIEGDYTNISNEKATWFIDPPYEVAGSHYKVKFTDYTNLAEWCKDREGQAIVCEQEGASWLPFEPFRSIQTNPSKRGKALSKEVLWVND